MRQQFRRGSVGGGGGLERVEHLHDDGVGLNLEHVAGRQEAVEAQEEVAMVVEENRHAGDDVDLVDPMLIDVAVDIIIL